MTPTKSKTSSMNSNGRSRGMAVIVKERRNLQSES